MLIFIPGCPAGYSHGRKLIRIRLAADIIKLSRLTFAGKEINKRIKK